MAGIKQMPMEGSQEETIFKCLELTFTAVEDASYELQRAKDDKEIAIAESVKYAIENKMYDCFTLNITKFKDMLVLLSRGDL